MTITIATEMEQSENNSKLESGDTWLKFRIALFVLTLTWQPNWLNFLIEKNISRPITEKAEIALDIQNHLEINFQNNHKRNSFMLHFPTE